MSVVYIHWPFCVSKCYYCDFNSVACCETIDFRHWLLMYEKILQKFADEIAQGEEVTSVYFGGGTPSLLPGFFVDRIIDFIATNFHLKTDAEITIEVNPKTLATKKAKQFKGSGVNRVSVGVQSLRDDDLKLLGRTHLAKDAKRCVESLAEIFDNVSIDMIYNRPNQKFAEWEEELRSVFDWPIKHISLYELIIEQNTPLQKMIENGLVPNVSDDERFMNMSIDLAEAFGFQRYEVSNFAVSGFEGKHNLAYWEYEDYYGVGPGAHSRFVVDGAKVASCQVANNQEWLAWASSEAATFEKERLSCDDVFHEMLIVGLRSKYGFDSAKISDNMKRKYNFYDKLERLVKNSYVLVERQRVVLTKAGMLRLNLIVEYFVNG